MKESDAQSRMKRLKELFELATGLPAAEREASVERACGEDPLLRRRLFAMLHDWEKGESLFDSICESVIWPFCCCSHGPFPMRLIWTG